MSGAFSTFNIAAICPFINLEDLWGLETQLILYLGESSNTVFWELLFSLGIGPG